MTLSKELMEKLGNPVDIHYDSWLFKSKDILKAIKELEKNWVKVEDVKRLIEDIFSESSWSGFKLRGERDLFIIKQLNIDAKLMFTLTDLIQLTKREK